MYKGVNVIQYSPIDSIDLVGMSWVEGKGAKYLEEILSFAEAIQCWLTAGPTS